MSRWREEVLTRRSDHDGRQLPVPVAAGRESLAERVDEALIRSRARPRGHDPAVRLLLARRGESDAVGQASAPASSIAAAAGSPSRAVIMMIGVVLERRNRRQT